jgi:hypothetical protein
MAVERGFLRLWRTSERSFLRFNLETVQLLMIPSLLT